MRIYSKKAVQSMLIFLCFSGLSGSAFAVGGIAGFSTEVTQIANNIELVAIYAEEVRNIEEQIKQYETMLKNLEDIDDFNRLKSLIQNDLVRLAEIAREGNALAYSSSAIDEQFRSTYQGYSSYREERENPYTPAELDAIYTEWAQVNQDSVLAALKAANYQASQFESESDTIEAIQASLDSAEGALQALQAGGAIAAQQATQLQKLRELTMAQMQMHANYIAVQADRQAKADANKAKALERTTPLIDTPTITSTDNLIW